MDIPLSSIRPPKFRMREQLGDMEQLKKSIKEIGLLSPIIVREKTKGVDYEVVAGHRRYMACIELGFSSIKAEVVDVDDRDAFLIALTENVHRKSMDAIEEANAFNEFTWHRKWGTTIELARQLALSEAYVRSRLDLLELPEDTKLFIKSEKLGVTQGRELSRLDTEGAEELTNRVVELGLDAETTKKAVDLVKRGFTVNQAVQRVIEFPDLDVPKGDRVKDPLDIAREHIEVSLSRALNFVDLNLGEFPDGEEKAKYIHEVRYPLHGLVDAAIKLRKHGK